MQQQQTRQESYNKARYLRYIVIDIWYIEINMFELPTSQIFEIKFRIKWFLWGAINARKIIFDYCITVKYVVICVWKRFITENI